MAVSPVSPVSPTASTSTPSDRIDSMGLDMQSLLQIILTQLTYQDPLKPVDNFEFVSQLAQFTSLEQSRQTTAGLDSLVASQAATQTFGLLGRNVDVQTDTALVSGVVKSVSLQGNQPQLTVETQDGQFLTNATFSQIAAVR